MKKIVSFCLVICCASFFISSCKKDNTTPQKTKTELLTQGSWKFSAATSGGFDVSGALQSCQKDNIYTFASAGTGSIDEGSGKCDPSDPQTSNFTWAFLSNETMLQLSAPFFSGTTGDVTIISLTETELTGSIVVSGQTVIATFIH